MKRYFVDLYSLLAANPIEFYEGHVTTRVTFVLRTYSSSNRDFYLTVYLVTVAANDQGKKLYRALSRPFLLRCSIYHPREHKN